MLQSQLQWRKNTLGILAFYCATWLLLTLCTNDTLLIWAMGQCNCSEADENEMCTLVFCQPIQSLALRTHCINLQWIVDSSAMLRQFYPQQLMMALGQCNCSEANENEIQSYPCQLTVYLVRTLVNVESSCVKY